MSDLCTRVHSFFNQLERFHFPFDKLNIPLNGIYILFELNEKAHGGDRIVRVGTHTGNNQLRARIQQHFVQENKDRSIFRKNIGRALLNKDGDDFLNHWEIDLTTREAKKIYQDVIDFDKQRLIEEKVSSYLRDSFYFVFVQIDDKEKRLSIESKIISCISLCQLCCPSNNWLGLYSPKEKIRQSGLWQVNELYKNPLTDNELNWLETL